MKTLKKSFKIQGIGLFSGEPVEMVCEPYDLGVVFEVQGVRIPASIDFIDDDETSYTTTLKNSKRVRMTEHLLSAFYALEISNVLIKLNKEEVPFTVNSRLFVDKIKEVGTEDAVKNRIYHVNKRQKVTGPGGMFIEIVPHDGLSIR